MKTTEHGPPQQPIAVSVIVPCYNEIEALPQFIRQMPPVLAELTRRHGPTELVLVDDGSRDGTGAALREAFGADPRVSVHAHPHNMGLGAALRTGFSRSRGEVLVTTDADGTYDFAQIPSLLERLTPEVDLVTASPYHPEGAVLGVPAYRLVLSRGASLLYRGLLDPSVYTYTSMFRAYRRRVVEEVSFVSSGYLSMAELLSEALLCGFVVAEYPAVLKVRQYGQSKARVARIIRDHLRFQAGLLLRTGLQRTARLLGLLRTAARR